ncbi:MAG: hypothetical protein Fur0032_08130 [Terrimicrobiaceae bacterium]
MPSGGKDGSQWLGQAEFTGDGPHLRPGAHDRLNPLAKHWRSLNGGGLIRQAFEVQQWRDDPLVPPGAGIPRDWARRTIASEVRFSPPKRTKATGSPF